MPRHQLTVFIPPTDAINIEQIRQQFNPTQYALIKSHITLCREDELQSFETVLHNLNHLKHPPITLQLGNAMRFSEGKGVLLPIMHGAATFQQLRQIILKGVTDNPRLHQPHITLLHPRNATCTDDVFTAIQQTPLPSHVTFPAISLIEQKDNDPWMILQEFALVNT